MTYRGLSLALLALTACGDGGTTSTAGSTTTASTTTTPDGTTSTTASSTPTTTDASATGTATEAMTSSPTTDVSTTDVSTTSTTAVDQTTGGSTLLDPSTTLGETTDAASTTDVSSSTSTTDATNPVDPPPPPAMPKGCVSCECCDPWPISWADVPGATHYLVRWKCSINPEQEFDVGDVNMVVDVCEDIQMCNGMCAFTVGYIRVLACNDDGCSAPIDIPADEIPISCGGGCCC